MGDARTYTAAQLITDLRYELRDEVSGQYADAELLSFINKYLEITYEFLIYYESDLVRTGTGTITTAAGTQSYALASNSMGDFWLPHKIWVSEYEEMEMCPEEDIYAALHLEEKSETGHRRRPIKFCLVGDYVWFEQVPDDTYTVNLRYYPNFVVLANVDATIPLKNLFNQQIVEGVKVMAKYRNELNVHFDALLKEIYEDRAMKIMYKRSVRESRITPKIYKSV